MESRKEAILEPQSTPALFKHLTPHPLSESVSRAQKNVSLDLPPLQLLSSSSTIVTRSPRLYQAVNSGCKSTNTTLKTLLAHPHSIVKENKSIEDNEPQPTIGEVLMMRPLVGLPKAEVTTKHPSPPPMSSSHLANKPIKRRSYQNSAHFDMSMEDDFTDAMSEGKSEEGDEDDISFAIPSLHPSSPYTAAAAPTITATPYLSSAQQSASHSPRKSAENLQTDCASCPTKLVGLLPHHHYRHLSPRSGSAEEEADKRPKILAGKQKAVRLFVPAGLMVSKPKK